MRPRSSTVVWIKGGQTDQSHVNLHPDEGAATTASHAVGAVERIWAEVDLLPAVHDALRDEGITSLGFPITPSRVWEAIRSARLTRGDEPGT